jgi:hypothetical protein
MKDAKPKKLKLKDTESVAALFADDLVRYFRMGGDIKNLTAQKVYTRLRGSDEKVYNHGDLLTDIEATKAESEEFFGDYPYVNDGKESRNFVDLMFDFDLTDDDHNYLVDKLNLPDDSDWSMEQSETYANEAMKLRGIREGDRYLYLKAIYHNTNEEVDFDELSRTKKPATARNNAVIYARYSSSNQQEQSIDGQIRVITEFAERKGYRKDAERCSDFAED